MFRLINKNTKIIYYNYEELGFKLIPTEKSYKILSTDNKDVTNEYIVSVSTNLTDDKGRKLYTEDRVDFNTMDSHFCFGTIKYDGSFYILTNNSQHIPLSNAINIHLSEYYDDGISGLYL